MAWHRTHEAHLARTEVDQRMLFDDDIPDADYEAALAEATVAAQHTAGEKIREGITLHAKLLRAGHTMGPWWERERFVVPRVSFFADPERLYDIESSDVVCVNVAATAEFKARRAAEAARRATVQNRNGHNGAELVEVIS